VLVVTWDDAVSFAAGCRRKKAKTYRLPTEAEWEYACRAGTTTRFWSGDKEDDLKAVANIADASAQEEMGDVFWTMDWDDGYPFTSPWASSSRTPSAARHDRKRLEWCADWHDKDYPKGPVQDPQGPAKGTLHITRAAPGALSPNFAVRPFATARTSYRSDCVGFRWCKSCRNRADSMISPDQGRLKKRMFPISPLRPSSAFQPLGDGANKSTAACNSSAISAASTSGVRQAFRILQAFILDPEDVEVQLVALDEFFVRVAAPAPLRLVSLQVGLRRCRLPGLKQVHEFVEIGPLQRLGL